MAAWSRALISVVVSGGRKAPQHGVAASGVQAWRGDRIVQRAGHTESVSDAIDDLGTVVDLRERVDRVISLVPSLTEALETSKPGVVAAATDWCTHPTGLDVLRIGGTKNPNLDAITDLAPDLVVANDEENRAEDLQELRRRGLPVWVTDIRTVDGALTSIERLLALIDGADSGWLDQAEAAWADPPRLSVPASPGRPVRAVVPIWRRPWMALGSDTYAGDVLRRLNVANVLADDPQRYPRFDPDTLASYDLVILPDEPYAFTATNGPEAFPGRPFALVDGRSLTWYGPAMIAAPHRLARAIGSALADSHPGQEQS